MICRIIINKKRITKKQPREIAPALEQLEPEGEQDLLEKLQQTDSPLGNKNIGRTLLGRRYQYQYR